MFIDRETTCRIMTKMSNTKLFIIELAGFFNGKGGIDRYLFQDLLATMIDKKWSDMLSSAFSFDVEHHSRGVRMFGQTGHMLNNKKYNTIFNLAVITACTATLSKDLTTFERYNELKLDGNLKLTGERENIAGISDYLVSINFPHQALLLETNNTKSMVWVNTWVFNPRYN